MPKLSPTGHIAAGVGGEVVSIDGVSIGMGGGASWLNDETIIYQRTDGHGRWWIASYNRVTKEHAEVDARGANAVVAGGGRWAAYLASIGVYGSLGSLPLAGVRDCGPDGTIALVDHAGIGLGVTLYAPDGRVTKGAGYSPCSGLRVLGPDDVIYIKSGTWGEIVTLKGRRFKQVGDAMAPILVTSPDGDWICYYTSRLGRVAHPAMAPDDPRPVEGWIIAPVEGAFNYDVCAIPGALRVVYSRTQGERPQDLEAHDIPWTWARVNLEPPIEPPPPPPIKPPPIKPPVEPIKPPPPPIKPVEPPIKPPVTPPRPGGNPRRSLLQKLLYALGIWR
jgi:hypothetical protein